MLYIVTAFNHLTCHHILQLTHSECLHVGLDVGQCWNRAGKLLQKSIFLGLLVCNDASLTNGSKSITLHTSVASVTTQREVQSKRFWELVGAVLIDSYVDRTID